MKKLLSVLLASAMTLSLSVAALADNNPEVFVDGALVDFPDQAAEIVDDRTLVPVRGVFEIMGAGVDWDGDTQTVTINSKDNITRIVLTIGSSDMTVYTFTSLFKADSETVTLDVAPQLINDRTMVPLRAISESLKTNVKWDADNYAVYITTKDAVYNPYFAGSTDSDASSSKELPTLSLVPSKTEVSEGDEVNIFVNISSLPADSYVSGVTALVEYNTDNFEFVSSSLCSDGTDVSAGAGAENPFYKANAAKIAIITINPDITVAGNIARLTFKAKNNGGGDFALVNSYDMSRGYNSFVLVSRDNNDIALSGNSILINTTPVTVAGK